MRGWRTEWQQGIRRGFFSQYWSFRNSWNKYLWWSCGELRSHFGGDFVSNFVSENIFRGVLKFLRHPQKHFAFSSSQIL